MLLSRASLSCLGVIAIVASPSGVAALHPDVDRGRALFEEGALDEALAAYASALEAERLTRDDLVSLTEGRILIYYARSWADPLRTELATLAAIDPEHHFGAEAPPELIRAFEEAVERSPGAIAIEVETTRRGSSVRVAMRVRNDVTSSARRVELHARPSGGAFETSDGELTLRIGSTPIVEYYAVVYGPGDAILASTGSPESPRQASAVLATARPPADDGDSTWLWIGIAAGGAVLAAGVALVVLFATMEPDELQSGMPTYPMVPPPPAP